MLASLSTGLRSNVGHFFAYTLHSIILFYDGPLMDVL